MQQEYIILRDISKSFGNNQVLKNINLTISEYDFIAIVGRSGCGKSTLLRLLANLNIPDSGKILFDNKDIKLEKSNIRLMFQEHRLLPWKKVIQNVGLGIKNKNWQEEALQALFDVGLQDKSDKWPMFLSGGQKQRVALARALIHKPKLLLLDEPLGALDALTRLEMQQLIENLWKKYKFTIILVTHDINEAVLIANRIILLDNGSIDLDVKVDFTRPRINNIEISVLENKILNRILSLPKTLKDYEI